MTLISFLVLKILGQVEIKVFWNRGLPRFRHFPGTGCHGDSHESAPLRERVQMNKTARKPSCVSVTQA